MADQLDRMDDVGHARGGHGDFGFVQTGMPPSGFNARRIATARPVWSQGVWYFRLCELSDVLGMRQPHKLLAAVRQCGGVVVSGCRACGLRDSLDTARTAFVSASDALLALDGPFGLGRLDAGMVQPVRDALAAYADACGPG